METNTLLDREMATVGELDRFEDPAVSVRPCSGRKNKKGSSSKARKVVMVEASVTSNRLPEKRCSKKGSSMHKEVARLDGKEATCGDPRCKVGLHPPVNNMMFLERIESILSSDKPAPSTRRRTTTLTSSTRWTTAWPPSRRISGRR